MVGVRLSTYESSFRVESQFDLDSGTSPLKQPVLDIVSQPRLNCKHVAVMIVPPFLDRNAGWSDDFIRAAFKPYGTVEAYEFSDELSTGEIFCRFLRCGGSTTCG
jgi:hypothetical protein